MTISPAVLWVNQVRAAEAGPALMKFLESRFARPYETGPILDDRRAEGPEEVFEHIAKDDEAFRARLDETIADYFRSPAADPSVEAVRPVIRALLETVQRLALTGVFAPLRTWLDQHTPELREVEGEQLGRAALGALATSQPQGLTEVRDFWLRWWHKAPPSWQPRTFIGLRLQDPRIAALQIPELLRRSHEQKQDPSSLLLGLWKQPGGRDALAAWLLEKGHDPVADEARRELRRRLPESEWAHLGKPTPGRCLPSLASRGDLSWNC